MKQLLAIISIIVLLGFAAILLMNRATITKQAETPSSAPTVTSSVTSPTASPSASQTQMTACTSKQLTGTISPQGAAGSTYGNLVLANTGKTACTVTLGNTVTVAVDANNVTPHYQQNSLVKEDFVLSAGGKVYSQIRYPNGAQCQSGVTQKPINFSYNIDQVSVPFVVAETYKQGLTIQVCKSPAEETTIDIWPLSKNPITQ